MAAGPGNSTLVDLARLFLRLGATAFGGPLAHVAMMEDEVVRRRAWMSREEFLDLVGATQLIPGPNSTELAIHVGHRRAGWPGLVVAGLCFILPAMVLTWAMAWAYVRYGQIPQVAGLLYGVKPVMIAVVAQALIGLGRSALKNRALVVAAAVCLVLGALGLHELVLLLAAGLAMALTRGLAPPPAAALAFLPPLPIVGIAAAAAAATPPQASMLFFVFLKVGALLFGSGYVLLAFLRAELVVRLGWLSEAQLLDAIAVGQATPGPVFSTATFVGYVLLGDAGAALATAGIFLPAFVLVALSGPVVPRLRRSPFTAGFLDGVNVASLALMALVSWPLGRNAIPDLPTALLALASAVLLLRSRVNATWLVLGGGLAGLVLLSLGWGP
jgi:chromate transporter